MQKKEPKEPNNTTKKLKDPSLEGGYKVLQIRVYSRFLYRTLVLVSSLLASLLLYSEFLASS